MSDNVYKLIEVTGTSTQGLEGAIQNAIARASKTIRRMRWFQVVETRGSIEGDQVQQWQVTIKIGFSLEE
jgi:hypothetical protein